MMVYPVRPVPTPAVPPDTSKVMAPAAPRLARLVVHVMVASAPAARVAAESIVTVRIVPEPVTAAVQAWAAVVVQVQVVAVSAAQVCAEAVNTTVPLLGTAAAGVNLNSMAPARAMGAPVASEVPLRRPLTQTKPLVELAVGVEVGVAVGPLVGADVGLWTASRMPESDHVSKLSPLTSA